MKKTINYWKKRTEENLAIADKLSDAHLLRLQKQYYETLKRVDAQINRLYVAMLKDGEISTTNLYRAGRWMQLKSFIEQELGILGQYQATDAQMTLESVYQQVLGKTYQDLDSSLRWGFVEQSQMQKTIDSVWSGEHFSNRIWGNTTELANKVEKSIKDLVSLGRMPDDIKKQIMNDFNVGLHQADRLVRTESMFVLNQAQAQAYQNASITQYKFLAAIDSRISDVCRDNNGTIYNFSQAVAGVNMPPLHPFCRSTIGSVLEF
jgi:SPP1 gp7 family putative phage head morphogenesis protein